MSTIRNAILLTATHLERNPQEFDFHQPTVPKGPSCGTCGCALGWMATFWNILTGTAFTRYAAMAEVDALGLQEEHANRAETYLYHGMLRRTEEITEGSESTDTRKVNQFYHRMDALAGGPHWRDSAELCATTLRKYADKYHAEGEAEDELIPAMVKAENERLMVMEYV